MFPYRAPEEVPLSRIPEDTLPRQEHNLERETLLQSTIGAETISGMTDDHITAMKDEWLVHPSNVKRLRLVGGGRFGTIHLGMVKIEGMTKGKELIKKIEDVKKVEEIGVAMKMIRGKFA